MVQPCDYWLIRLQTYRTNEQMMQAMKGATMALGSMNKSMNLPQLQRIAMEFERENDIMEQRQEMMDDAVDDAMDVGVEEEGDEVVDQVLEEIGVDLNQAVSKPLESCHYELANCDYRWEKHLQRWAVVRFRKARSLRRWAVEAEEAIQLMMICRQGWTV